MSVDLSIGQLISLSPPGREVAEIAKNLDQLGGSKKIDRFSVDFLEKTNSKINHKPSSSSFLISSLTRINEGASPDGRRYYLNAVTGEVFSAVFSTSTGLVVDKVDDRDVSSSAPLFSKIRHYIITQDLMRNFEVALTQDPSQIVLVHGVSQWMEYNFWSIHASCEWVVKEENGGYLVSGSASVAAHYYENCNFHIKFGPISFREKRVHSVTEIFKRITAKIFKLKLKINNRLVMMDADFENHEASSASNSGRFSSVHGIQPVSALKKLRRQLPVHKAKFDWNIARVQLVQSI